MRHSPRRLGRVVRRGTGERTRGWHQATLDSSLPLPSHGGTQCRGLLYRGWGKYFMHQNKHELHFCMKQSWHKSCVVSNWHYEARMRHRGRPTLWWSQRLPHCNAEILGSSGNRGWRSGEGGWCDDGDQWAGRVRYGRVWGVTSVTSVTSDQVPGCGHWLRWAEQPHWPARPGRCWLANVWCRPCHEPGHVTRDGGSLGSVTPGCVQPDRARDPGGDTESGAQTGTRVWHSVCDTPATGRHQCHQHRDIVTKWCNATQDNNHSRELRKTLSVRVFKSFTTQQNFTPSWSFYFGPVLIFLSRRAEVYLIVSIRISQPVKSFIGAVSWARREKKVVLNPRHVQRSFELGQQWSIELLRYISFKISSWPFQNWIWKWNGWILFYATFQLIA